MPDSRKTTPTSSGRHQTPTAISSLVNIPTTARMRHPVPPSPLSNIEPEDPIAISALSSPDREALAAPATSTIAVPQASPCFIHSHLDRHGSLQDWLKNKTATTSSSSTTGTTRPAAGQHRHSNATKPVHRPSQFPPSSHQRPPPSPSPSRSGPISPKDNAGTVWPSRKEFSSTGYDSDQSGSSVPKPSNSFPSSRSSVLNGIQGDNEESESLTKQLAETAQGVREMSKELGRTKVRSRIRHVLIVTKARDNRLIKLTRELALYLMQKKPAVSPDGTNSRHGGGVRDRGMVVYVDAQLRTSKRFDAHGIQRDCPNLFVPMARRRSSSSTSTGALSHLSSSYPSTTSMGDYTRQSSQEGQLRYWTSELCSESPHLFDFVITLGGDGTVLFTSWLFQRIVPPVLPFALGSLGFLTNFDFYQYKHTVDKVVDEGIRVNLRMRFTCTVYRAVAPDEKAPSKRKNRKAIKKPGGEILMSRVDKGGWESLEGPTPTGSSSDLEGEDNKIMCYSTRPVEQFEVLNDLVVDRGPSPYVSLLELFGDENHLTTVQADGLTVSTPTGSTAYSLSAGGSLVHPQIPAILITPICPHTLSFRPMLLPDSMEVRVCVPYNSRSTAWASFDGRGRVELKQGDHIKVTASKYPFPTVCADKASTDWFSSISRTLRWNEREKQKSFAVVEEAREPSQAKSSLGKDASKHHVFDESKAEGRFKKNVKAAGDKAPARDYEDDDDDEDEDDDEDDEYDEDEDEETYDIDDKSGPSSPPVQHTPQPEQISSHQLHRKSTSQRHNHSGLETPNRFATPYSAPPALSQRHLVEALTKVERAGLSTH